MKNMKILAIILLLVMNILLGTASAAPFQEWNKTFKEGVVASSIRQTSDGGYIFLIRPLPLSMEPLLIKTDASGSKQWSKKIDQGAERLAMSVTQTSDKGYIIAGYTDEPNNGNKGWLIKTDSSGNKQWKNVLAEPGNSQLVSVLQTVDGKYVTVGYAGTYPYEKVLLAKTYSSGETDWSKKFVPGRAVDVAQTKDGGYVIGYNMYSSMAAIIKTDQFGFQKWQKTFNNEDMPVIKSIQQTTDGGYVIGGNSISLSGGAQLLKIDSSGNKQWSKIYNTAYEYNEVNSVRQTKDGGYIIGGSEGSLYFVTNWVHGSLIRTDSSGNMKWLIELGSRIYSAEVTKDSGYIVSGVDGYDLDIPQNAWIAKVADPEWAGWQQIGLAGSAKTLIVGHDNTAGSTNIYSVHQKSGNIYKYDNVPLSWTKIGGPGKMFATRMKSVFKLSPDGSGVWRWDGTPEIWTKVRGSTANIYGGGDNLIATDPTSGDVYRYNGKPMSWTKIGGPGRTFAVGDGNSIYMISSNGKGVWKWDGVPDGWTKIADVATNIYAGGTVLYMTSPKGDVYKYNDVPFSWTKIGGPGKTFAVTSTGQLYGLSPDGNSIWRWTGVPGKWIQMGGAAKDIFGGAYGNRIYAINANSDVLQYIYTNKYVK